MEHSSIVLSPALPEPPLQSAGAAHDLSLEPSRSRPKTLHDLVERFEEAEAFENEDALVPMNALRTPDGDMLMVPKLGTFGFTDWSRRQCAALLGVRWDRWFENASAADRAEELNRRFKRTTGTVRVRTSRESPDVHGDGTLRAFVSPGYSPVADSRLARMLATVLAPVDPELRIVRSDVTDRSVSYVVKVGEAFRPGGPSNVGDLWGGLLVRNSGVGFASLLVTLHLTRLLCKNGMTAPLPDAVLVRRRHRSLGDDALRELLVGRLEQLPERLARGAELLRSSRERFVPNVEDALTALLVAADLPQRHVPALLSAYAAEPEPTAFGIAQAVTRAAQSMSPEVRLELELAAGTYIAQA